jgi:hypothetical protein
MIHPLENPIIVNQNRVKLKNQITSVKNLVLEVMAKFYWEEILKDNILPQNA